MNKLENNSGQVASFDIKTKDPNNANNHMQQENEHMLEQLGHFEILEAKLRDEVMTTQ